MSIHFRLPGATRTGRGGRSAVVVAGLTYVLLAAVLTWPWVTDPAGVLTSPIDGDVASSVAKFDALADAGISPYSQATVTSIGFPGGLPTVPGVDRASFLSAGALWLGAQTIDSVATHGVSAFSGYVLTALSMLLLVRAVTGSALAGWIAGLAFGFFGHMQAVVWAASTYGHMWLFVLPLWAAWRLAMRPTARAAVVLGLSALPALYWTPYYSLHVSVLDAAAGLAALAIAPGLDLTRRAQLGAFAAVPWLVGALGLLLVGLGVGFAGAPDRASQDAFEQSAHVLMYVLPGFGSPYGDGLVNHLVARSQSANLYLGIPVLGLAVFAIVEALRHRLGTRERAAVVVGATAAAACFVFSLPPDIGPIPMPNRLVVELVPGLRAGQRFVMPLMACVSLVAGVGAWRLLLRVPPQARVAVGLLIAAVVGLDHWTSLPERTSRIPKPTPAVLALRDMPPGPAIHIQPDGYLIGNALVPCLMQETHEHPLVNTCRAFETPDWLVALGERPLCDALAELRVAGLRYVLADRLPRGQDVVRDCVGPGRPQEARLIVDDGHRRLFAWAATPARRPLR